MAKKNSIERMDNINVTFSLPLDLVNLIQQLARMEDVDMNTVLQAMIVSYRKDKFSASFYSFCRRELDRSIQDAD